MNTLCVLGLQNLSQCGLSHPPKRDAAFLALTARAHEYFLRANIEQKRKLLTLIFANLEMQGANLHYTLRKPFDVLAQIPESANWRARRDSNPRPAA